MDVGAGNLNLVSALAVSPIVIVDRSTSLRPSFRLSGTNAIYWK